MKSAGRKPLADDSQIINAAKSLIDANDIVTGWKLRRVLGAGNPTRLMKIWETNLAETGGLVVTNIQSEENSLLPPEVEDALRVVLGDLNTHVESMIIQANNAAVRAADKRVSAEYNASKKARQEAERELAEAEIVLSQADAENEKQQIRIQDLEELYRKVTADLQSSKTTNASLEKQLTNIKKERDELDRLCSEQNNEITENKIAISTVNNRCEQLLTDIKTVRSEKTQTDKELLDTKQQLAKNEGVLEFSKIDIENKTKQLNDLSVKLEDTHTIYEGKLTELSEQIGTLKSQKATANDMIEKMKAKHQNLINECKENMLKIQSDTAEFTAERIKEIESLEKQLAASNKKVKNLEANKK